MSRSWDEPPSQSHSHTSVASARSLSRKRVHGQERWVYETLRKHGGKADWQLWEMIERQRLTLFDKLSSLHRARIGLLWRSRILGATPWHPVKDSGRRIKCPESNKLTVVWQLKSSYKNISYEEWARDSRNLARGKPDSNY